MTIPAALDFDLRVARGGQFDVHNVGIAQGFQASQQASDDRILILEAR